MLLYRGDRLALHHEELDFVLWGRNYTLDNMAGYLKGVLHVALLEVVYLKRFIPRSKAYHQPQHGGEVHGKDFASQMTRKKDQEEFALG